MQRIKSLTKEIEHITSIVVLHLFEGISNSSSLCITVILYRRCFRGTEGHWCPIIAFEFIDTCGFVSDGLSLACSIKLEETLFIFDCKSQLIILEVDLVE